MTIPNSKKPEIISRTLGKANIKVATNSVARIKEFLGEKKNQVGKQALFKKYRVRDASQDMGETTWVKLAEEWISG